MKKVLKLMMATAVAIGTFTACEDVPEPYVNPYDQMGPSEPEAVIEPEGDGTQANPWNVAGLLEACNGLGSGEFLNGGEDVYARGIVTETTDISTQYKNATYYISDDRKGTNRFYVYRGKLLDGKDVEDESDLQVGDSVVVCGKVKNYNGNTLEFDQGNKIVFYKKGEGGPTLDTPGTVEAPLTVEQALDYINNKLGAATSPEGYVKGFITKIDEVDTSNYGNATYYISDDKEGSNSLMVYRGYSLGGEKFKSASEIKIGDEVIVKGKLINFKGNTPEVTQGSSIYSLNGKTSGGGGDTPAGNTVGTKDAPKTVAEAVAAITAMADGATSSEFWYVTGKVIRVTTNQANFEKYGNLNYLISADGTEGTTTMTVYSGDGLDGAKFSGIDALKQGDEVVVYGQLQKYVNSSGAMTPEIAKGNYLVKYTAGGGTPDTPPTPSGEAKGSGTAADPFNAIAAINYTVALGADVKSDNEVYVKGKISSIKYTFSAQYGTATFNISDDGQEANVFTAYSCLYFGKESWKDGNQQIKVGDEVIVCGKVIYYSGTTPEFASKDNYLVSLNGKTSDDGNGGGNDTPGGDVAETGDNGDFENWADGIPVNWKSASTASSATLEQSTDAHGGSYAVKVCGSTAGNKRLAYKEMKLAAGTYTMKFYAKSLAAGGSLNPGIVPIKADGSAGTYAYSGYVNDISTDWQLIEATIEVASAGTYCFVVMNPKSTATDVLIDDFTVMLGSKSVIK